MDVEHEKPSIARNPQQPGRLPSSMSNNAIQSSISSMTKDNIVTDEHTKTGKEFQIEFVQGASEEDKSLFKRDKNAVEFVFNYSKLWCKACKDIVLALEKCACAENEACRIITKQFQALESSVAAVNGAPMQQETLNLARMMIDKCKDTETNNSKRCRELLEVLTRQRTLFEKTRKYLKEKWKSEVKRLLDAENILIKTKTSYYQRCQTGVKLREELAVAQNTLNEMLASQSLCPSGATLSGSSPGGSTTLGTVTIQTPASGGVANLSGEGSEDLSNPAASSSSTSSQMVKQKAKVERLEKQLSDNDKKEFEQMYSYREAVESANNRLYDLEKCKMEIIADTRLTILKSDEVARDSLAELFQHLFNTRMPMINQYEQLAAAFQAYVPCSGYRALVEDHLQKSTEYSTEKYQFTGFHEASSGAAKSDALPGRFLVRVRVSSKEAYEGGDVLSGLHSDSESDEEQLPEGTSGGKTTGSSNMLSSLVEFGSSFFRSDAKKSIRNKRGHSAKTSTTNPCNLDAVDNAMVQEKECASASFVIARCVAAIERQPGGLETHGIYRVPPSKAKTASLMESLNSSQPTSVGQFDDEVAVLSQEHPLTLAGLVKSRLIALPEPLLTYNLYPNFVELGKIFEVTEEHSMKELVKRLQLLVNHLGPSNRKLAGLVFHHLNRIASCQSENQMTSINLGTMFAPTVLRQKPKFQVANMMEFVDNKGQSRVVEVMIDRAADIFGPKCSFDPLSIFLSLLSSDESEPESRRGSGLSNLQQSADSQESTRSGSREVESTVGNTLLPTAGSTHSPQHGLLRSATISAASSTRSPVLLSNPLPLYSPYSDERRPLSFIKTELNPNNVGDHDDHDKSRISQAHKNVRGEGSSGENVKQPSFTNIRSQQSTVQSKCPPYTVATHAQQNPTSTTSVRSMTDKRGNNTLSNLVIGRRLQPSIFRETNVNSRRGKADESLTSEIEDCGFIDMEGTDVASK